MLLQFGKSKATSSRKLAVIVEQRKELGDYFKLHNSSMKYGSGKKQDLTPFVVPSSDQSAFMQGVAKGPYMDAFAEFHDGLHELCRSSVTYFNNATFLCRYITCCYAALYPIIYLG